MRRVFGAARFPDLLHGHSWVGYCIVQHVYEYGESVLCHQRSHGFRVDLQKSRIKSEGKSQSTRPRMDIISIGLAFLLAGRLVTQQTGR